MATPSPVTSAAVMTGKLHLRMLHGYMRACFISKAEQDRAICLRYGIEIQGNRKDGSSQND